MLSGIRSLPGCLTDTNLGSHMPFEAASDPLRYPLIYQAASPLSPPLGRVAYILEWARQLLMLVNRDLRETRCLPMFWLIRCIGGGALEELLELCDGRIAYPLG